MSTNNHIVDIRLDWELLCPVSNKKHKDCHFGFRIGVEDALVTIDYYEANIMTHFNVVKTPHRSFIHKHKGNKNSSHSHIHIDVISSTISIIHPSVDWL